MLQEIDQFIELVRDLLRALGIDPMDHILIFLGGLHEKKVWDGAKEGLGNELFLMSEHLFTCNLKRTINSPQEEAHWPKDVQTLGSLWNCN